MQISKAEAPKTNQPNKNLLTSQLSFLSAIGTPALSKESE